jgi:hypothetical protein
MASANERRAAYTVGRRVRAFYLTVLLFAAIVIAFDLFLAIRTLRAAPAGAAHPGALALASVTIAAFFASLFALVLATIAVVEIHRTIGPARKIADALRARREGRPPEPVRLREKDYLQDVAAEVNALIGEARAPDATGT